MSDRLTLLRTLEEHPGIGQREFARSMGISVGSAHSFLKALESEGLAVCSPRGNQLTYRLTEAGTHALLGELLSLRNTRLSLRPLREPVETAVILAAGRRPDFDVPVCLLPTTPGGETILARSIRCLKAAGIRDILVVAGYRADLIRAAADPGVTVIENPRYTITGTMSSLSLAAGWLENRALLLVEGDLVYEESLLPRLLQADIPTGIVVAGISGSGDEGFVQMDEEDYLTDISKDIRRLNTIDGEMIGVSKISPELFSVLRETYAGNRNPYLNYEYLIANAASLYRIPCLRVDDLVWGEVDGAAQYDRLRNTVMPTLAKRENDPRVREAERLAQKIFALAEVPAVMPVGGMTNTSYAFRAEGEWWVLRISGAGTEHMIDRRSEAVNNRLASEHGFNAPTRYFDPETGTKVTRLLPDAETLTSASARLPANTEAVALLLRRLHTGDLPMSGKFDALRELERYEKLNEECRGRWEPDYAEIRSRVLRLRDTVRERFGTFLLPCHNDMVAENFIRSEGRLWLIDWEYAGFNDPAWDLGAFLLENELGPGETEFFLHSYAPEGLTEGLSQRIRMNMLLQDLLWSVWTWEKEASGCDFGDYGAMRYGRLKKNLSLWETELSRL